MLNFFGSISSIPYQFLVLESPFIKVIFMKNTSKIPYLKACLIINCKGLELFSKTNFESCWVSEGLKICKTMYFVLSFCLVFCPCPFKKTIERKIWRDLSQKMRKSFVAILSLLLLHQNCNSSNLCYQIHILLYFCIL